MRKFAIFLILFYQLCYFNQGLSWADSSLEDEVKQMKEQFASMQKKMNVFVVK